MYVLSVEENCFVIKKQISDCVSGCILNANIEKSITSNFILHRYSLTPNVCLRVYRYSNV